MQAPGRVLAQASIIYARASRVRPAIGKDKAPSPFQCVCVSDLDRAFSILSLAALPANEIVYAHGGLYYCCGVRSAMYNKEAKMKLLDQPALTGLMV